MLWAKRIAGNFNIATDLLLLADGNILFTGKRQGNAYDAFVIKADLDGTVIWLQFYGTESENSEFFTSVVETPDNGFLCEQVQGLPTQEGTLRFPVSVPRHSASRKPHEISREG